jgi:hypothetical protein
MSGLRHYWKHSALAVVMIGVLLDMQSGGQASSRCHRCVRPLRMPSSISNASPVGASTGAQTKAGSTGSTASSSYAQRSSPRHSCLWHVPLPAATASCRSDIMP